MRTKHQSDNLLARFPVFLRTLEEKKDSEKISWMVNGDSFFYENNQNFFRTKQNGAESPRKVVPLRSPFLESPET